MKKRPKSREETPKEGSDSARRYRTTYANGNADRIRLRSALDLVGMSGTLRASAWNQALHF